MTDITTTVLRPVPRRVPMVVAVFSFRYDAALVPALVANITPMVHGFVSQDDRMADSALSDEPGRRNRLHTAARAIGADWILAVDPDERFEAQLAQRIGDLTADTDGRTLWVFNRREMFSATAYRTDGLWGLKTEMRLYPASATRIPLGQALHGSWVSPDPAYRQAKTGINLYHLRHATAARTRLRRDTYAAADPERRFQHFGYDYLTDLRGAQLTEIGAERAFSPPHVEDGGLWAAADIGAIGHPGPDPIAARLHLMAVLCRQRGAAGAAFVAGDICQADPADTDMRLVAANMALRSGQPAAAVRLAAAADDADGHAFAQVITARAWAALGDHAQAMAAMARAADDTGPGQIMAQLQHDMAPDRQDFAAADARWRRWTMDGGQIHDGPRNGIGKLAVIVMAVKAPATLARAVDSVRSQSPEVEIVVVNSGGGDARRLLQRQLDQIRLIETATPLFVGAARNIGIESSRAPYVAFLAADCEALPGWVAGRLARHAAGALMVSTAVEPARPGTVIGSMAECLVFPLRSALLGQEAAVHYGRSYDRALFAQVGLFAPRLRVAEDTEFHRRTDTLASPVWAPEIRVRHDDPQALIPLLLDLHRRGQRAAFHLRPLNLPLTGPAPDWVKKLVMARQDQIRQFLQRDPGASRIRKLQLGLALRLGLMVFDRGVRRADKSLAKADSAATAAKLCAAKDLGRAIILAGEAVALVPQNATFRQLLGDLLLQRGSPDDFSAALAQLRQALALVPTAAHTLWRAATALHQQGQTPAALALCEDAVIAAAGTSAVLLVAARVAHWSQKPEYALLLAQQALAADPASIQAHQFLEQLHRRSGQIALADRRKDMANCLLEAKAARSRNV